MQPPLGSFDGMRAFPVFHLLDGMIDALVEYLLFAGDFRMADIIDEGEADTSAVAGVDERILRTGVESIFAINKFRMKHNVALLRGTFQIRKAFPVHHVFGARDSARSCGC